MASHHLAAGSEMPERIDGKWRLYSMEYCPYAHRARLILNVKNVPYDIVNCNLINKPEWLFTLHPEGKVPALDTGSEVIVESLDICNYIEKMYPNPPLYSIDPAEKEKQQKLISSISDVTDIFTKIILEKEQKTPEEWLEILRPHMMIFEDALAQGGPYFGGAEPCMVDYMLWPWGERAASIPLVLGSTLPVADTDFPQLRAWRKTMRERPEIGNIYHGANKFMQVVFFKTRGVTPDYDNIA